MENVQDMPITIEMRKSNTMVRCKDEVPGQQDLIKSDKHELYVLFGACVQRRHLELGCLQRDEPSWYVHASSIGQQRPLEVGCV